MAISTCGAAQRGDGDSQGGTGPPAQGAAKGRDFAGGRGGSVGRQQGRWCRAPKRSSGSACAAPAAQARRAQLGGDGALTALSCVAPVSAASLCHAGPSSGLPALEEEEEDEAEDRLLKQHAEPQAGAGQEMGTCRSTGVSAGRGERSPQPHSPRVPLPSELGPCWSEAATHSTALPMMGSRPSCTTRQLNTEMFFSCTACTATVLLSSKKPSGVSVGRGGLPVFISIPFSSQVTLTLPG